MYRLLVALLYPVSLLPLRVLYGLSTAARLLLFGVIGYRRAVVRDNLRHAFPERDEPEIEAIRRRFERAFCDQWVETLKLLSLSENSLRKRLTGNWEVFAELQRSGKNAYVLLGHQFNWEWAAVTCQWAAPQLFAGVYLPLENKPFDRLMQRIRTRGGGALLSMKALREGLRRLQGQRYIIGLIADQNPSQPDTALWLPFMNREAPFFRGAEALARRDRGAVVFASIRNTGRGRYAVHLQKRWDDASDAPAGAVTEAYVRFLEAELRDRPHNWLWSHRRWKHRRLPG